MKRNAIVNRVPVHEIGLTGSSDVDDRVHTDELRKTSSVLSGTFDNIRVRITRDDAYQSV